MKLKSFSVITRFLSLVLKPFQILFWHVYRDMVRVEKRKRELLTLSKAERRALWSVEPGSRDQKILVEMMTPRVVRPQVSIELTRAARAKGILMIDSSSISMTEENVRWLIDKM